MTAKGAEMQLDHVDVLIVGAGLSGIGAAHHLQERCPGKSYAILEAREAIGGTWDLFRYPGIRSDTEMHTLGYRLRPWDGEKSIADGASILEYVRATARENGIDRKIRFNHRLVAAEWSSADSRWTVDAERSDTGELVRMTCGFLEMCSGYYRYDQGYSPEFPGVERFSGQVVHPQDWTDDIDYEGKRVVVIGSGATAVTLLPSLAERARHVTMLQRSPSYVIAQPGVDPTASRLRRLLPAKAAATLLRWRMALLQVLLYQVCRRAPKVAKAYLRKGVERRLPAAYDVDTHFTPRYEPWDQRICIVRDGDFFKALSSGRAEIVTDRIATFTEQGIQLESGVELAADLIVTATGLNLNFLADVRFTIDGEPRSLSKSAVYKEMMLSDFPNFILTAGWPNHSWTLKSDLTAEFACRLLNHMDSRGFSSCVPRLGEGVVAEEPMMPLTSGYVMRSLDQLPKRGNRYPWRGHGNYVFDLRAIRYGKIEDGELEFSRPPAPRGQPATQVLASSS
jgi:cation diffusion facilitator CzcD-associated flavoprotein CzcO